MRNVRVAPEIGGVGKGRRVRGGWEFKGSSPSAKIVSILDLSRALSSMMGRAVNAESMAIASSGSDCYLMEALMRVGLG